MTDIHRAFRLARAVPIMDVVAKHGIKLRRSGKEYVGACPVCGDGVDRFSVHPSKKTDGGGVGLFNCRVCETGGDVIELVCFLDKCDRHTAARKLAGMPDKLNGKGDGLAKAIAKKKAKASPPKEAASNVVPLPVAKAPPPKDDAVEAHEITVATFPHYTDAEGTALYAVDRVEFQMPERAAAVKISNVAEAASVAVQLLTDIKRIFDGSDDGKEAAQPLERISSAELASQLASDPTSPWSEWKAGKPMSAAQLTRVLKPFHIYPDVMRLPSGGTSRGYLRAQFEDVWGRYL